MPPRTITSTWACMAMRESSWLYGSPDTEKMGSFWLSTRVLNTSIMGIPVRISLLGTIRRDGFTEGPPMGIIFSVRAGPLSRGTPAPSKMRPSRWSEKDTIMGRPRKRTGSVVLTPWVPLNTCSVTRSLSSLMTLA